MAMTGLAKRRMAVVGMAVMAGVVGTAANPSSAGAKASCQDVHGRIVAQVTTEGCDSAVFLCTTGTISGAGPLNGASFFTALALAPGAGLSPLVPPSTLSYTGDFVITTKQGTLTLRDVGIADFANALFTELDSITSGTGKFAGASGNWFISGFITGGGTGFDGDFDGQLCVP